MVTAAGVRIGWQQLPQHVRAGIESIVGGRVVEAVSQPGGFSPGTADRVRTDDGRRAFVKAVSAAQNGRTPDLHRREARIAAALPASEYVPEHLGTYDDGEWVALVLEDVEGRHPRTPWREGELAAALRMLRRLAEQLTPAPLAELPLVADELAGDVAGWERVDVDPPPDLDPWAASRLIELRALTEQAIEVLTGDTLVHLDVRADNLLVRPDGDVVLVDWPWACRGPAWLDTVMLLINVHVYGGHEVDRLLAAHAPDAAEVDVTAVLAGLTGYLVDVARRPAPRGLPTVRAFQQAQADALLPWLRARVSRSDGVRHAPREG